MTRERDEYLDALQRLKAEFDNFRKRVARDQGDLVARASERLVKQLLPVLDDLERALEAAAAHEEAQLEEGVRLVHRALADALAREGLVEVETEGAFDPHTQEALLSQPSEADEGTVIQVLQKGYRLGDRVLRPARVVVSAGAPARPGDGGAMPSSLYETLGVPKNALGGRDQEGLPQARPPVPPGQEPGRRGGRDALQGGPARLRRALGPREAEAVRPASASERPARPGPDERRLRRLRPRRHLRRALRRRPRPRQQGAAAARPARRRRRGRGARLVRGLAARASQATVPVELELACHTCHGTGAAPGTAPKRCPECDGTGVVATSQGLFALQQPCPRCRGNGTVVETPCPTCHGTGRERRTKRYTVRIPAGVKDGTKIKLKGKGEAGWGGAPAGDLFVVTRVEPSKLYERRGDDLVLDVPVTFDEAALGATVEIPTPGRPRLAEGARRLAGRQAAARQGPRRAEAEGRRPRRPARARARRRCRRS